MILGPAEYMHLNVTVFLFIYCNNNPALEAETTVDSITFERAKRLNHRSNGLIDQDFGINTSAISLIKLSPMDGFSTIPLNPASSARVFSVFEKNPVINKAGVVDPA